MSYLRLPAPNTSHLTLLRTLHQTLLTLGVTSYSRRHASPNKLILTPYTSPLTPPHLHLITLYLHFILRFYPPPSLIIDVTYYIRSHASTSKLILTRPTYHILFLSSIFVFILLLYLHISLFTHPFIPSLSNLLILLTNLFLSSRM